MNLFGKVCKDIPSKVWICKKTKEASVEHHEDGICIAVTCSTHKSGWCCIMKELKDDINQTK